MSMRQIIHLRHQGSLQHESVCFRCVFFLSCDSDYHRFKVQKIQITQKHCNNLKNNTHRVYIELKLWHNPDTIAAYKKIGTESTKNDFHSLCRSCFLVSRVFSVRASWRTLAIRSRLPRGHSIHASIISSA